MTTLRLMAIDAICQRGSIRDSDIATLRRAFAQEFQLVASDIDALFRAQSLARVKDPGWSDFFIETLTDYVVRELEPTGYVTAAHAGWLIARVSNAGRVRTKIEHDLLFNVIDKARWVPESLMTFALVQIREAVVTGEGALRAGAGLEPGCITLSEVEQIRRLLFAYGNEGPRALTQAELDIMLDIEAALSTKAAAGRPENHTSPFDAWPLESWRDLIDKAVANAALAASGYAGPSREEALGERRPLLAHGTAGQPEQSALAFAYRPLNAEARALMRLELQRIEIITGEPVSVATSARLATRLAAADLRHSAVTSVSDALVSAGFSLAPELAGVWPRATINAA